MAAWPKLCHSPSPSRPFTASPCLGKPLELASCHARALCFFARALQFLIPTTVVTALSLAQTTSVEGHSLNHSHACLRHSHLFICTLHSAQCYVSATLLLLVSASVLIAQTMNPSIGAGAGMSDHLFLHACPFISQTIFGPRSCSECRSSLPFHQCCYYWLSPQSQPQ